MSPTNVLIVENDSECLALVEQALQDEAVRALARKISVTTYAEYADILDESPAKVAVHLTGGRTAERVRGLRAERVLAHSRITEALPRSFPPLSLNRRSRYMCQRPSL